MAERLEEIKARVASIRELQVMVNTMRALAAGPARQAQAVLPGMRAYSELIGDALATATRLLPDPVPGPTTTAKQAPRGVIVFCAEHGFAGAFSRKMIDAVSSETGPDRQLFVVGSRGVAAAEEQRLPVAWSTTMASRLEGVTATAHQVTEYIYREFLEGKLRGVEIVYARPTSAESAEVERQSLLPLDLTRFPVRSPRSRPITYLPTTKLLENLVGEYVFAELAHAAVESFASENTVRLSTMTMAKRHIEDKLSELTGEGQRARQEQITSELLELVTGAEELAGGR